MTYFVDSCAGPPPENESESLDMVRKIFVLVWLIIAAASCSLPSSASGTTEKEKRRANAQLVIEHDTLGAKLTAEMAALRSPLSLLQESHADLHTLSVIVNSKDIPMVSEVDFSFTSVKCCLQCIGTSYTQSGGNCFMYDLEL